VVRGDREVDEAPEPAAGAAAPGEFIAPPAGAAAARIPRGLIADSVVGEVSLTGVDAVVVGEDGDEGEDLLVVVGVVLLVVEGVVRLVVEGVV